jgi:hypothetical protein
MNYFPDVVDSTLLAGWKSCQRKAELESFLHWKPREISVHLHAGAAFARGIEVAREEFFVKGRSPEEAGEAGIGALLTAYGTFECPEDSPKSATRMAGALEFYLSQYPLGEDDCIPITLPGGKRGIEFSFVHPLPINHPTTGNPLLYCGRMDALCTFAGGTFIVDEKTTSQLGASWSRQWDLRSQFTGYAWGCREAGIHVDGALIRGISILKTKYDTQQAITYRPEWQIARWFEETLETIEEMIVAWKRGRFRHDLDHACAEFGGCRYRQICLSQNPEPWLAQYFEQRRWDPVTRTETKL